MKRDLLEKLYEPGMDASTLARLVEKKGGEVSGSYARRFVRLAELGQVSAENTRLRNDLIILQENMGRLEQLLYSADWQRLLLISNQEFSRDGVNRIIEIARIMRVKNPIIKRGVRLQVLYTYAQGVYFRAEDEEIDRVLQRFIAHERNKQELTGHQALTQLETDLQTDGNVFIVLRGIENRTIRCHKIDPMEISEIICAPDDRHEKWLYKRVWERRSLRGDVQVVTDYHPDINFNPASFDGIDFPVKWDEPIYHLAVNRVGVWGISEFYDAIDWARAYKGFLEQLASVWQALARWSAKLTVPGGKRGVQAAKTKLGTTLSGASSETNPPPVAGSIFLQSEGTTLAPFRTSGATMSADDGRRLLLMAGMAFGFPETYYGDVSVGTLATAKSLDRPTELQIRNRQNLWASFFQTIFSFVVRQAIVTGELSYMGKIESEEENGVLFNTVMWNEGIDATIHVSFPPIVEQDKLASINALARGEQISDLPGDVVLAEVLRILGINNSPEILKNWREAEDGEDVGEGLGNVMQAVAGLLETIEAAQ